ncbi:MAG: PspA/IM30 family protein [Armatimonadetes bacterium]|nr:PspA/IM30 family protein [Armatimonadota bacterium]
MGLLERIKALVKANVNEVLRQAEDPEQALDNLIRTMEEDLAEARAGVAAAARDERKLRDTHEQSRQEAATMLKRAEQAVAVGNDELAREALRRRRKGVGTAEAVREQWETESRTLAELRANLAVLEAKIEQVRRKREALLARRRLARVRRDLQETSGVGRSATTEQTFNRLSDRIDDLEAEAEAYAELALRDVQTQVARLDLEQLETATDIEAELQGIKDRLRKQG